MPPRAYALLFALPACFHPFFGDHPACGLDGACPRGLRCDMASGFCERPGINDAGVDDAGIDDAGINDMGINDAPDAGSAACLQRWLDHTVDFDPAMVQELTSLSSAGNERDPWISPDGNQMYFARDPGASGGYDLYTATRTATSDWSDQGPVFNLNSLDDDEHPALTSDLTTLTLSTNRNGLRFHIVIAIRPSATDSFGSPDERHLANVNADAANHYDPFLSGDGLRLYLAEDTGSGGRHEIKVATRPSTNDDFTVPENVDGVNSPITGVGSAALSNDERVMVFTETLSTTTALDLYYATRTSAIGGFGAPVKIMALATSSIEANPMLSSDACELYFDSNRTGGRFHLFRARVR
jgi:hypothetical protein